MLEGTELPPEVQFLRFVSRDSLVRPSTRGVLNARALRMGPALEIGFNVWKVKTSVNWGIKREDFDKVQF